MCTFSTFSQTSYYHPKRKDWVSKGNILANLCLTIKAECVCSALSQHKHKGVLLGAQMIRQHNLYSLPITSGRETKTMCSIVSLPPILPFPLGNGKPRSAVKLSKLHYRSTSIMGKIHTSICSSLQGTESNCPQIYHKGEFCRIIET